MRSSYTAQTSLAMQCCTTHVRQAVKKVSDIKHVKALSMPCNFAIPLAADNSTCPCLGPVRSPLIARHYWTFWILPYIVVICNITKNLVDLFHERLNRHRITSMIELPLYNKALIQHCH